MFQNLPPRLKFAVRVTSFLVAFLVTCVDFNAFAFTIYLNAIKSRFNITQSQVETIMSMNFLGLGATFPAGAFVHRYGIRLGTLLGLVLATGAYLAIYDATTRAQWYTNKVYLLDIYFFVAGCGCGTSFICAMTVSVQNFTAQYRGFITGVITAGCNIGPLVYTALYNSYYLNDYIHHKDLQNIEGFFLLVALTVFVTNLLGLIFFEHVPPDLPKDEQTQFVVRSPSYGDLEEGEPHVLSEVLLDFHQGESAPVFTMMELLRKPVFHLLVWPSIVILGLEPMNVGNLTTYLYSLHMEKYIKTLPYFSPAICIIFKFSLGFLSDKLAPVVPRYWFIIAGFVVNIWAYLIAIFFLDVMSVMVMCLTFWNLGGAVINCAMPSILISEFGMKSFSRLWGGVYFGAAIATCLLQNLFGIFYDMNIMDELNTCYGLDCFTAVFAFAVILTSIGLTLMIVYVKIVNRRQKFTKNLT